MNRYVSSSLTLSAKIIKTEMVCIQCNGQLKKNATRYCCTQCQQDYLRNLRISKWLNGEHDGMRGKTSTAAWIKFHLIETRGNKCEECGWNKVNPYSGNVPIELEHIDGNFKNNSIDNLKLLCPNCHSLTSTYKGANKKEGRPRKQYNSRKKEE